MDYERRAYVEKSEQIKSPEQPERLYAIGAIKNLVRRFGRENRKGRFERRLPDRFSAGSFYNEPTRPEWVGRVYIHGKGWYDMATDTYIKSNEW